MKEPARYRTRSGRAPRARVHADSSPIGRRQARIAALRTLGVVLGILLVFGIGVDAYGQSFVGSLPRVAGLDSTAFSGDALLYDRNGQLLADLGQRGDRRVNVPLSQVSPKVTQATVAVEDKNFWTNPGFDVEGIGRAAVSNLHNRNIVGGGSTITQQLAKQLFLSPDQTLDRKLKELVLAYQLNQTYSKDQILELYLNKSYYGEQQYGIQAAARTFFLKDARDLDLAQSALLAGLPQAPDQWSPIRHPEAAKLRQKDVLDAMVRAGYATSDEARAAYQEKLDIHPPVNNFLAPHFVQYVIGELERLGFKPGQQQMLVKTTLDYGKQQLAEQVLRENLDANRGRDRGGLLSSALVSMDPRTGQVVSYVGSPGFGTEGGQQDFVGMVPRNLGSSVKPFTYLDLINARKATMDTPIADSPSPFQLPGYRVENYDKRSHGVQPLRVALASSLNIPAVKAELAVGVPGLVEFYRGLGMFPRMPTDQVDDHGSVIYSTTSSVNDYGPSLTLGGYPITLLEEVSALSVIAGMGVYHQPETIQQVTDLKGKVLYEANPEKGKRQVVDPAAAFITAQILSDDANRAPIFGYGTPLHMGDRHSAAKTGTTENYKDALTIGFTPDLATVVWVGDILGINNTMTYGSDGVYVAAPAWHRFMTEALKGVPDRWYDPPPDVTKAGNSWFFKDTLKVDKLPNDNPVLKPTQSDYGVPGDPGTGPVRVDSQGHPPMPGGPPVGFANSGQ